MVLEFILEFVITKLLCCYGCYINIMRQTTEDQIVILESRLDRTQDFKKVAKIVAPYTEIKEIYKNLKTNKNSNIFY